MNRVVVLVATVIASLASSCDRKARHNEGLMAQRTRDCQRLMALIEPHRKLLEAGIDGLRDINVLPGAPHWLAQQAAKADGAVASESFGDDGVTSLAREYRRILGEARAEAAQLVKIRQTPDSRPIEFSRRWTVSAYFVANKLTGRWGAYLKRFNSYCAAQ